MILSRRSAIAFAATVLTLAVTPMAMTQPVSAAEFATRSNDTGGVRVDVTPKSVAAGSAWQFEVVMDTHTKSLDDDLTKTAVLVDDGGRKYAPLDWQGDAPGGHHRKGVLRFAAPTEPIKSFELQIQGVGGDSKNKRIFKWTMK
jgi:hypothetical protein